MGHRVAIATAFAAATLFTSAAYAGSPYYDADAQALTRAPVHSRVQHVTRAPSQVSPRAAAQYKTSSGEVDMPTMASDGFATPETDREVYDHAEGTMGTPDTGGTPAVRSAAVPVYTAKPPQMDADGFMKSESDKPLYEHAVGTMGTPVAGTEAPSAPKAQPVYTAQMPQMDPDGFEHRESDKSFYEHAVGTMGTP